MGPIRGQTRPLPITADIVPKTQHVGAKLNASIHNRFDVEVIDSTTGKVRQRAQAENVICNQLWSQLVSNGTYFYAIHYGSGIGTPSSSDTHLFSYINGVYASNDTYTHAAGSNVASLRKSITLSETTSVGSTITEVGIGYGTSASTLCTHAMLKDANGNQISIVKTATDIINIYATVYVHFSNEFNGIKLMASSSFLTSCMQGNFTFGTPYFNAGPSIGYESGAATSTITRTNNVTNKTITLTVARLGASAANTLDGIGSICMDPFVLLCTGSWHTPVSITGEAIGTGDGSTKAFSTACALAKNAKIYVNGVEQTSGVSVGYYPSNKYPGSYLNTIDSAGNYIIAKKPTSGFRPDAGTIYFENPYRDTVGITSVVRYCNQASNDLINWVTVASASDSGSAVPLGYQKYKYWKISEPSGGWADYVKADDIPAHNIVFDAAPASGAVITADYTTDTLGKDANHVYDFALTIQFGEYTA